jgi:uncharacterized membrane protein
MKDSGPETSLGLAWFSRRPIVALASLSAVISITAVWAAINRPLWYDELFTYYVSSLGTPSEVLGALLGGVDNNPPIDYLIRHWSLKTLGDSPFAFRLPSIIAALIASACVYTFVRKRTSFFPAAVAFAFPLSTLAVRYYYEGRPYILMVASGCLALIAWQRAVESPKSISRLSLLAVALSLGPFCHYYGVVNYAPVVIGEATRSVQARRISWPIILSIAISFASLVFLYPFASDAGDFRGHFWTDVSRRSLTNAYRALVQWPAVLLLASVTTYLLLDAVLKKKGALQSTSPSLPGHEFAAAVTFCFVPLIVYLLAELYTGAFTVRYTITSIIGPVVLAGYVTHLVERKNTRYGAAMMVSVWLMGILYLLMATIPFPNTGRWDTKAYVDVIKQSLHNEDLPIVIPHSHRFLETFYYLPPDLKRKIYYIADRRAAVKYMGFDTDEIALENLSRRVPINVSGLCGFVMRHPRFIVLGKRGWLLKKLKHDRARIRGMKRKGIRVSRVIVPSYRECSRGG